jgi:heme-degrading monooxygenase HmoA
VAILMVFEAEVTEDQYRGLNESMGIHGDADAPDGLISHHAGRTENGVLAVDVWESEEKLHTFFEERLGPAIAALGVPAGEPTILPVHNMIPQGAGANPGVLVLIDVPGFGPDTYDRMVSQMDAHVGDGSAHPAVSHTAAKKGDGMFVADVWDSPDAFGAFAQSQIAPAGEAVGLGPLEPRIVPVINRIRGR